VTVHIWYGNFVCLLAHQSAAAISGKPASDVSSYYVLLLVAHSAVCHSKSPDPLSGTRSCSNPTQRSALRLSMETF